ncbi:von Hippel-Lindau disease tumor suppressor [Chlorella vulgaris]
MGASASRTSPVSGHRSLNCHHATDVEFVNCTDCTVTTTWLDYSGMPRAYYTLGPGAAVRQPTFGAHPWVFESDDSEQTCVVDNQPVFYPPVAPLGAPATQACIRIASPLPWSPAHHLQFPAAFRAEVAALLLCHRRLQLPPPTAPASHVHLPPQGCWLWQQQQWLLGKCPELVKQLAGASGLLLPAPSLVSSYASLPTLQQQHPVLGDVPKDLLLEVVAAAAPLTLHLVKPLPPHGISLGDLPPQAVELFRVPCSASSSSSSSSDDTTTSDEYASSEADEHAA